MQQNEMAQSTGICAVSDTSFLALAVLLRGENSVSASLDVSQQQPAF